jgi:hypothetical protein
MQGRGDQRRDFGGDLSPPATIIFRSIYLGRKVLIRRGGKAKRGWTVFPLPSTPRLRRIGPIGNTSRDLKNTALARFEARSIMFSASLPGTIGR